MRSPRRSRPRPTSPPPGAACRAAQINLGYAAVTAPISGRIGRALVTEGALVGQGEATPLAVVQQINPMYVNFTQSTTDVLQLRRAIASGKFKRAGGRLGKRAASCSRTAATYPQAGRLLFSDLTVDPTSGQITLRAEVPNPTGCCCPACTCGCGSSRPRRRPASSCRSRR